MSVLDRDPKKGQSVGYTFQSRNLEKCFGCGKLGHNSFECSKPRMNLIKGNGEDDEPVDGDLESPYNSEEEALRHLEETGRQLGVMHRMYTNTKEEYWRRTSIFHTFSKAKQSQWSDV